MDKIYLAQAENLRIIEQSLKQVSRLIKRSLRENDSLTTTVLSKVYIQAYCAWSEAAFSKLIHTPNGLTENEVQQIRRCNSISEKWEKALELALIKISSQKSGDVPNKKKRFTKYMKEIIIEPSKVRNKIAHGQWGIALNRKHTQIHTEFTKSIDDLDFVKIRSFLECHKYLNSIFADMVQSPNKAHHRDYWHHLERLEEYKQKTKKWNKESLSKRLKNIKKKWIYIK